ncbi:hypothetical protein B0H14DRAFT_2705653 [Mycena olivaceomarginata]|nr:hypothetical protein B0H14DRAFT_2705653 [Mycena olivaceomarginata]
MPVLSRLIPVAASAYALQTLLALIFVPQQNEKYYDLGGAAGFLSTTFVSLKFLDGRAGPLPSVWSFAPRQLLLSVAIGIWSARLGDVLGCGARLSSPLAAATPRASLSSGWLKVQRSLVSPTWVLLVGLPVYMVNVLPPHVHPALAIRDYAAFGLFASSFIFEVLADHQKTVWKRAKDAKQHDEKFITRGLWSISRHPNYVGEVGIWTGIWALASASLPVGSVVATAASPLFTWFLLRKVSGVPPLEKAGDKKFGGDPKWEEYKRNVPVFWPWGSKN